MNDPQTLRERLAEGLPYRSQLRRLVWNLFSGSPTARDEVEDVLQDAWISATQALETGTEVRNPRAWLFQLTRNLATDRLRGQRGGAHDQLDDDMRSLGPAPDASMAQREAIREVLSKLTLSESLVLRGRLRGLSHADIAESMGVRVESVATTLSRARRALLVAGLEVQL